MTSRSAIKAEGGRRKGGGSSEGDGVCLLKWTLHAMEPCFPRDG